MIINNIGIILFLSLSEKGRKHDKRIAERLVACKKIVMIGDLGFYGYQNDKITIKTPIKKTKGKELTTEQKEFNRKHNSSRVKIENVFAQLKVFRIIKDRIRSYSDEFKHLVMIIATQIYNFKIFSPSISNS